jgi:hypothetical protein
MTFIIDGGDAAHGHGEGGENLVEGANHCVLGNDGDVVLAFVAGAYDSENLLFGPRDE